MLFKRLRKEKVLTEEEQLRNNGFCPYRSKCTDFGKTCYKCGHNGLNEKKSYFTRVSDK